MKTVHKTRVWYLLLLMGLLYLPGIFSGISMPCPKKPLTNAAGIPKLPFHSFRHTLASLLLSQNVPPKVVQEMLGHSTITLTLDTYSHVLPDMQQEAANKLLGLQGHGLWLVMVAIILPAEGDLAVVGDGNLGDRPGDQGNRR